MSGSTNNFAFRAGGMLAGEEKELVAMVAREMAAGIDAAVAGWMADIEDILESSLSDSAKLSAIQSVVNVCKRESAISR